MTQLVAWFSGPERTRANTEVALEDAKLPIFPPDHYAVGRKSYSAEDCKHLTTLPSGKEPSEEHGFVAILAQNIGDVNRAAGAAEPHGWVLRMHYDLPPEPKPDPIIQAFNRMEQRIAELEHMIAVMGVRA